MLAGYTHLSRLCGPEEPCTQRALLNVVVWLKFSSSRIRWSVLHQASWRIVAVCHSASRRAFVVQSAALEAGHDDIVGQHIGLLDALTPLALSSLQYPRELYQAVSLGVYCSLGGVSRVALTKIVSTPLNPTDVGV